MKKYSFAVMVLISMGLATLLWAADTIKISRMTRGFMVQGGTTDLNGSSVVVSDSTTNEYKIVVSTATVAGAATAATNTFTTAFLTAPTIIQGVRSGTALEDDDAIVATVTATNLIVTGMATGGINSVKFILYGTQRSGLLQ